MASSVKSSEYQDANILGFTMKIRPRRRQGANPLVEGVRKFQEELLKQQEKQSEAVTKTQI